MSDPMKQAWSEVGDEFSSLGRLMKDRYQAAGSDAEAAVDDSTKAAGAALARCLGPAGHGGEGGR